MKIALYVLVCAVVIGATIWSVRSFLDLRRHEKRSTFVSPLLTTLTFLVIGGLVTGAVTLIQHVLSASFKESDSAAATLPPKRRDTIVSAVPIPPRDTSAPPLPGIPISNSEVCPDRDPSDPVLLPAEICVVYWCKGPVISLDGEFMIDQIQLKIRPRIINNSAESLRLGIGPPSSLRLLVTAKDVAGRWRPPPHTKDAGDRPVLIAWKGQTYWGVPPNQPRDAYPTPIGAYTGFATVWDGTVLGPGQSYFKPRRPRPGGGGIREGDLVFQVPLDATGDVAIIGIAVVIFNPDGTTRVVAFEPRTQWPKAVNANEF